jgi:hypothetical protein
MVIPEVSFTSGAPFLSGRNAFRVLIYTSPQFINLLQAAPYADFSTDRTAAREKPTRT